MDEQKALLQALWRKAYLSEVPIEIPCKTKSNATRMRFALYNAVREVRKGNVEADSGLKKALENCTIGFSPEDPTVLVLQKKIISEFMQTVHAALAADQQLIKSEEEMKIEASQERFLEKLKVQETGQEAGEEGSKVKTHIPGMPRVTPYYTR